MTRQNILTVSADLINHDLRNFLLEKGKPYISDYKIDFNGGYIFAEAKLEVPTLGALSAQYQLKVIDLIFHPGRHVLTAEYQEDIKPTGGAMQSMLLKAASLTGGSLLQKALTMTTVSGLSADEKKITLDFDQLGDLSQGALKILGLEYIDSRDGLLKLEYSLKL
ncbi:MAG TPA: hypothetical protein GX726_00235 [Clostridiales bacterium]|jgi:hypothetical protein|nr:hypothetical protein [Clostridiales bacterium]